MDSPSISVTAPISAALTRTRKILFEPFDIGKWFVLGFCAWLAWIGQHGGGGGGNWKKVFDSEPSEGLSHVDSWIQEHMVLVVIIVSAVVVLAIGLAILFTWLSSRGKLMFLDGVVHDRAAVVEPWRRFRELGNSLFGFRMVVLAIAVGIVGLLCGGAVAVFFGMGFDIEVFGVRELLVFSPFLLLLLVFVVIMVLIEIAINDLMVPIQWLRGCGARTAWAEARALVSRHAGTFVRYVGMKILLAIAVLLIACVATCLTCCIAALPYIGTVILLPLYVFGRSYSIYFLVQFGPHYAALTQPAELPGPP